MHVENLDVQFDYNKILSEFNDMSLEKMLLDNERQIAVQCREETPADKQLTESCGSLIYDWDNYYPEKDYTNSGPQIRKQILKEKDFNVTCDIFKGTYIGEVVDELKEKYNVHRGRFMLSNWKTCLTLHKDLSRRIHLPIITDKNCIMIIDNTVYRLPFGGTYLTDTRKEHTAVNASKILRTHLVFCTNI